MPVGVSIIVPTRNRRTALRECLRSLLRQEYGPFEVVVVDDASDYDVAELVDRLHDSRIRVLRNERRAGKSEARNRGARHAAYGLIAFIDDDCTADRMWLRRLLPPFENPELGFVIGETCFVAAGYAGRFPERVVQNLDARWPSAGNLAYRASTFEALGGFDRAYDAFNNEDSELGVRAVSRGVTFARRPDARVYHRRGRWTVRSLLASAGNAAVLVRLVARYGRSIDAFGSRVLFGRVVHPLDYALLLSFPLLLPLLFIRYWRRGGRDLLLFFAKWPVWFVLKRLSIWREAVRSRRLMV